MPRCLTCKSYRYSARKQPIQPHHTCVRNPSPIDGLPMKLDAEAERRLTNSVCCGPSGQFWVDKNPVVPDP